MGMKRFSLPVLSLQKVRKTWSGSGTDQRHFESRLAKARAKPVGGVTAFRKWYQLVRLSPESSMRGRLKIWVKVWRPGTIGWLSSEGVKLGHFRLVILLTKCRSSRIFFFNLSSATGFWYWVLRLIKFIRYVEYIHSPTIETGLKRFTPIEPLMYSLRNWSVIEWFGNVT